MDPKQRGKKIIKRLETAYPDVHGTILNWTTPLDLLIATILSAQSTDKQINKVTETLFKKYRTAADYANAPRDQLINDIRSSGFHNRKAEAIQSTTQTIVQQHNGKVPDTMEQLIKLKGVARKTANIVLSGAYNKTEGIAIDTHVFRLAQRLELTQQKKNRDKIEQDLMQVFPKDKWFPVNYLLITHGRRTCNAKKPDCQNCVLTDLCPAAYTFPHNKKK